MKTANDDDPAGEVPVNDVVEPKDVDGTEDVTAEKLRSDGEGKEEYQDAPLIYLDKLASGDETFLTGDADGFVGEDGYFYYWGVEEDQGLESGSSSIEDLRAALNGEVDPQSFEKTTGARESNVAESEHGALLLDRMIRQRTSALRVEVDRFVKVLGSGLDLEQVGCERGGEKERMLASIWEFLATPPLDLAAAEPLDATNTLASIEPEGHLNGALEAEPQEQAPSSPDLHKQIHLLPQLLFAMLDRLSEVRKYIGLDREHRQIEGAISPRTLSSSSNAIRFRSRKNALGTTVWTCASGA